MKAPAPAMSPGEPSGGLGIGRPALALAGLLGIAALVLVYLSPALPAASRIALGISQFGLLAVYVLDRAMKFLRAPSRADFLRQEWLDLALLAAAAVLLAAGAVVGGAALPAAGLYILASRTWFLLPRRLVWGTMNALLALAGAVAVAALILEFGFRDRPPVAPVILHAVQTAVLAIFVLDRVVRLEMARDRKEYLRDNWVDFALMGAAVVAAAVGPHVHGTVLSAGALYLIITQAYILLALILRGVGLNLQVAGSGIDPAWLLTVSFLLLCLAGSALLSLPAATPAGMQPPLYYDDALFTSVSATCVTGLATRDTGKDFTPFGQAVILALIQLGGLGITLFGTVLALLVGKGLTVRSSSALGEMLATEQLGRLDRVVKFVIATTLGVELLGAILLYPMFAAPQGGRVPMVGQAVWDSVFHSVAAFCNAGFSLYGDNLMAGVAQKWAQPLRERWQVLGVIAPLIVVGGLGFPVLEDCARFARNALARALRRRREGRMAEGLPPRPQLALHTKLVLSATAGLLVIGAAGFLLLVHEPPRPPTESGELIGPASRDARDDPRRLRNMPIAKQIREALFTSVTARTAGFNTVDMDADLTDAARLWVCGLMIVGGSPASTAGGMKTITFVLLLLAAWSILRRREHAEVFHRTVPELLLRRAVTVAVLYLGLVGVVTLLLCVAMPRWDSVDLFFEACSACGTVGLSANVTPKLSLMGKLVAIGAMFAGRVGPLTLLLALTTRIRHVRYEYPTGNVVIG